MGASSDSPTQSPSSASSDLPTISTIQTKCAVENEKSKKCGSTHSKGECCPGLVCHEIHKRRCVPPKNKRCAIKGTRARKCGAWWVDSRKCCGGLVCNYETQKCIVSPDITTTLARYN